jgi:xanthine dehydrogenase YagR molybdenum-binding subunit
MAFGATFAEVRADLGFGTVRVPRIIGAYEAGRIVNPKLSAHRRDGGRHRHGAAEGGRVGPALWSVTNANLAEHLVPVCACVRESDAVFVPGEDTIMSPLGTRGAAELGLGGVAPAIANAVWHATGKRKQELPITPDKLLTA